MLGNQPQSGEVRQKTLQRKCLLLGSPLTFEIDEAPNYVYAMGFSVDSEYAYIVYRIFPPDYNDLDFLEFLRLNNSDPILGIYAVSTGTEVSRVDLGSIWEGFPIGRVRTVAHSGGVVVQADRQGGGTLLAQVDPGGVVTVRRHYEGVMADSLGRYRDFTMVKTNTSVMLLDDQLEVDHEWNPPEPFLIVAEPSGNDIVVLDGERLEDVNGKRRLSGTVRWLTLEGGLVEKASIGLPETLLIHPPPSYRVWPPQLSSTSYGPKPFLLVWPGRLWAFVHDGSPWQKCALNRGESEFACTPAAWHDFVFRTGHDGYVVADLNGCAIWARRYDLSDAASRRQPTFPSGSSSLGVVRYLSFKEHEGRLFVLISSSRTSGGDDPTRHTVLRSVEFSESTPAKATSEIDVSPFGEVMHQERRRSECLRQMRGVDTASE